MSIEFLCSYHGSFLYYDESAGYLRHGTPAPHNAALIVDDGLCWLARRVDGDWQRLDSLTAAGHIGLAGDGAAPLPFTERRLADGLVALEANGLLLSAAADGTVSLSGRFRVRRNPSPPSAKTSWTSWTTSAAEAGVLPPARPLRARMTFVRNPTSEPRSAT